MPPKQSNKNLIWIVGVSAIVGAFLYIQTTPDQVAVAKKPVAKKSVTVSDSTSPVIPADYTASFTSYASPAKDVFRPLVLATSGSPNLSVSGISLGIPPEFAGGDPNWIFTGTAVVDGSIQALLENKVTGDGTFEHVGNHWKNSQVSAIDSEGLTLTNAVGVRRRFRIEADLEAMQAQLLANQPPALTGNLPIGPPLSGPIGGPIVVTPLPEAASTAAATPPGNFPGRRPNRRRNN